MRKESLIFIFWMLPGVLYPARDLDRTKYKIDIVADVKSYQNFRGEHFFSTPDGILRYDKNAAFLCRIGRKGQGPGEFENFSHFYFMNGKLFVSDLQKIAIFGLDGKLEKERPNPLPSPNVILLSNDIMVASTRDMKEDGKGRIYWITQLTYHNLEKHKKVEMLTFEGYKTPGYDFEAIEPVIQVRYCEKNGRIYVSDPNAGALYVFNKAGERLMTIGLQNLKRVEVNEVFKNDFYDVIFRDQRFHDKNLAEKLKKAIHFSKYFPFYHSFFLDEDGNLLVRTFEKKGHKLAYFIFSADGVKTGRTVIEDMTFDVTNAEKYVAFHEGAIWQLFADDQGDYYLESSRI